MNFILIKYKKNNDFKNYKNKNLYNNIDYKFYLEIQSKLFDVMIKQINYFYPKSNIHIITNEKKQKEKNNETFHYIDFKSNHICKFYIYGLLKEPAIYLDCDIILLYKFKKEHLKKNNKFTLYSVSKDLDLQKISKLKIPKEVKKLYNAGIVYIDKPDSDIVESMFEINKKYFSDEAFILSKNEHPNNDEYAVSLYMSLNNISPCLNNEVNVPRWSLEKLELENIQTLHYTGVRAKKMLELEKIKFQKFNFFANEVKFFSKNYSDITLI
jgi:hypothetical protein